MLRIGPWVLLVAALLAGAAVAQGDEDLAFTRVEMSMDEDGVASLMLAFSFSGDTAREMRAFVDANHDDVVGESEATNLEAMLREEWNREPAEGEEDDAGPRMTLDGQPAQDRDDEADLDIVDGAVGPVASEAPLRVEVLMRATFALNDTATDEHVLVVPAQEGNLTGAAFRFQAPEGYEVLAMEGIADASLEGREGSGTLGADEVRVRFARAAEESSSSAGTGAGEGGGQDRDAPAFAALAGIAALGLAAVALRARRR